MVGSAVTAGKNMQCRIYKQYITGKVSRDDFEIHVRSCPECGQKWSQDQQIMQLAKTLRQPVNVPELWSSIARSLEQEKVCNRKPIRWPGPTSGYHRLLIAAAAVLVFAVSLTVFLLRDEAIPEKGLISASALKKVQEREADYLEAIAELEKLTRDKMAAMDINLMLLYRDRLETIDSQIARCNEALQTNPMNAHIRRYLFAALRDKKETLKEMMQQTLQPETEG
jgi:hypothetical protein